MAVFKNQYRYFSAMDSRVIRNGLLSVPALGMLTAFLDRSETWQFRLNEIVRSLKLTPDEAKAILSELTEKGFAVERHDPYGVYYDIYAYPMQAPRASGDRRTAEVDVPGAPHRDVPQSRDGQCPSADQAEQTPAAREPVSDAPEKPCGMTDEQRAANLELIRKLFPPTKDYKSPYRD